MIEAPQQVFSHVLHMPPPRGVVENLQALVRGQLYSGLERVLAIFGT